MNTPTPFCLRRSFLWLLALAFELSIFSALLGVLGIPDKPFLGACLAFVFVICAVASWYMVGRYLQCVRRAITHENQICEEQKLVITQANATTLSTMQQFMRYTAHVLRTPLNEVRWSVEMLKNEEAGRLTSEQRERMDALEKASIDVLGLAGKLQDTLLVMQGESLRIKPQSVDLFAVLDDVAGTFSVMARRKDIELVWSSPTGLSPFVQGDPDRLKQVCSATLENAIEYSLPRGHIVVRAFEVGSDVAKQFTESLRIPAQLPAGLIVCVEDHGIGIPEEEQAFIMQPFFRARNTKQTYVDGVGLSLAIARSVIQGLGGSLWFVSAEHEGTTLCFSLPFFKEIPELSTTSKSSVRTKKKKSGTVTL